MIYNSFNFIVLFPIIFLLYYVIPAKWAMARKFFLLITSYALYITWKPAYVIVLAGVTLVTYWGGQVLELRVDDHDKHKANQIRRKRLAWCFALLALLPLLVLGDEHHQIKTRQFLSNSLFHFPAGFGRKFVHWPISSCPNRSSRQVSCRLPLSCRTSR